MKLSNKILPLLICISLILTSFGTIFAEEAPQTLHTDESGAYLIGTADELFAFAELAKATAEANAAKIGSEKTLLSAKLTANINLNPNATFVYDHETGLVTVAKNGEPCKMGSGMKDTELGNFHPVYNGLCTWDEWNNENLTDEQLKEFRDNLIEKMNERVKALGLVKWTPIGTKPYIGTFDGNGHKIDGLYINDSNVRYTGLFSELSDVSGSHADGELKNLTIGENSLIVGYDSSQFGATGAFVGKVGFSSVSGCTNYATVVGAGRYYPWIYDSWTHNYDVYGQVGGIAGLSFGKIQNCVNRGTVVCLESAGGIAGSVYGYTNRDSSVAFCTNYGKVYAGTEIYDDCTGRAGGIAVNAGCTGGNIQFTKPIEACTNFGYVEGGKAGGIVQQSSNGAGSESILYCANRGTVSGSSSASGIVDYINSSTGRFVMEGCYNAGAVSILDNATRKAYPIASGIYNNLEGTVIGAHTIENCYNDKTVCPAEDDELFGTYITSTDCFSVPTDFFATGEPAYEMGSFDKKGWKQNIPTPAEEGKTPEIYPTTDGTRRVYRPAHYCCYTDKTLREEHKTLFYSNAYADITDEHDLNANGICEHCGKNTRLPDFYVDTTPPSDTLPEAKAGNYYNITIKVRNDAPRLNGYIRATVSETDDEEYTFTNGLTGESAYHSLNKYYYYSIYGCPTEAGEITFTLSATNENGTTKKTYTLKINEGDPIEIISDSKLPNATVGQYYNSSYFMATTGFTKTWSLKDGSALPDGLTLYRSTYNDYQITGTPTTAGDYSFTLVVTAGGQTAEKTFTLRIFEVGGCKHGDTIRFGGTQATCRHDGVAEYYHCNICDCNIDESGNEIYNTNNLKTASNHSDKNNDGKCDFCGKNMPIFKKVTKENEIVYGGTYILVTQINDKYYALATPPKGEYGSFYAEYMNVSEITPKADGSFDFNELESKDAIMLKTEFAAENAYLDKGTPRYGLSSVFGGKRYGVSDGNACFEMYENEPAKYGYRIKLDKETGAVLIGSVYCEWWSTSETADDGLLRAYDMTHNDENTKFMSLLVKDKYNGEKGMYSDAAINEYPIYIYRMTDVGTTTGGVTFISNDSNSTVSKTDDVMEILDLTDDADLSNANGISNAVSQTVIETAIEAVEVVPESVTAQIYADIAAKAATAETDEKGGKIPTSVTYSITPKIDIKDSTGKTLYTSSISDRDLNGAPITVSLYTGFKPEQIIHYKEDETKEYFYDRESDEVRNGAKSFEYENGFVIFTITDFSDFKILKIAEAEEGSENSLSFDGKTLTATVDRTDSYTLVYAGYEKDGRLSYLKTDKQALKAGENTVEIPEDAELSKVTKIFLWNNFAAMQPVCGAWEKDLK